MLKIGVLMNTKRNRAFCYRYDDVNDFTRLRCCIVLQVGGVGITLTAADRVVICKLHHFIINLLSVTLSPTYAKNFSKNWLKCSFR